MANKFHINPEEGTISLCRARKGKCPFGGASGEDNHFGSIKEAKAGYERMQEHKTFANTVKAGEARGRKIKYAEEKYEEREKVFPKLLVQQEIALNGEYSETKHFGDVDRDADFKVIERNGEFFGAVRTHEGRNYNTGEMMYDVYQTGPHGSVEAAISQLHKEYKDVHSRYQREDVNGLGSRARHEGSVSPAEVVESLNSGKTYRVNPKNSAVTFSAGEYQGSYYVFADTVTGYEADTNSEILDQEEFGPYDSPSEAANKLAETLNDYLALREGDF